MQDGRNRREVRGVGANVPIIELQGEGRWGRNFPLCWSSWVRLSWLLRLWHGAREPGSGQQM